MTEATAAIPAASDEERKPQGNTHFHFEHKIFAVPNAHFGFAEGTKDASYFVEIGELKAALALDSMAVEFGIAPDSNDGKLLDTIKKSLKFAKHIAPGDSIPREVLDGTASWTVLPHHHAIAKAKLSLRLLSWMLGQELNRIDANALKVLEAPENKEKIQEAFAVAAEKLGFGRDGKEQVVSLFENLAREMSFIEALRDRYNAVYELADRIKKLISVYSKESGIGDDLRRMHQLITNAVRMYLSMFENIDIMTGEILSVLKNVIPQVEYIRGMRDDLHVRMLEWDGILAEWAMQPTEREHLDRLIKKTYRFLAQRFAEQQDWRAKR